MCSHTSEMDILQKCIQKLSKCRWCDTSLPPQTEHHKVIIDISECWLHGVHLSCFSVRQLQRAAFVLYLLKNVMAAIIQKLHLQGSWLLYRKSWVPAEVHELLYPRGSSSSSSTCTHVKLISQLASGYSRPLIVVCMLCNEDMHVLPFITETYAWVLIKVDMCLYIYCHSYSEHKHTT